jgi:hypothetical protein
MNEKDRRYNQTIVWGCGLLVAVTILGLTALIVLLIQRERDAAHYPGSEPIVGHINYDVKPNYIRLDQAYLTQDDLVYVHGWYEDKFDLEVDDETEDCIILSGSRNRLQVGRMTHVSMCSTPSGQMVFITRLISRH